MEMDRPSRVSYYFFYVFVISTSTTTKILKSALAATHPKMKAEACAKMRMAIPTPPPPPLPRFWVRSDCSTESVTKQEIAKFWRQKHIEEEEHLLAAIKAAARIRARNLTEEDYKLFEESLKDSDDGSSKNQDANREDLNNNEVRVGIKDWWTKSKYAYLNQPAVETMDAPKKPTSTYVPNCFAYKPTPLYPTSVF